MNKDTGGYAFAAVSTSWNKFDGHLQEGMTLRDYFAAKAMASFVAQHSEYKEAERVEYFNLVPSAAYEVADAMLKARNK